MVSKTEKILGNLPGFFKKDSSSSNYKFINSFESELNDACSQIINLKKAIRFSTAVGSELDDIGKLFLLYRRGSESDNDFRARIKAYWSGYKGGGTEESIKEAVSNILGISPSEVVITEIIAAKLKLEVDIDIDNFNIIDSIIGVIADTKAAGIFVKSCFGMTGLNDIIIFSDDVASSPESAFMIEESLIDGDDLIG